MLKLDLSEDEDIYNPNRTTYASKQKRYRLKAKDGGDSFAETKFTLFSQKKPDSNGLDDPSSFTNSNEQEYSIYSYYSESRSDISGPITVNQTPNSKWNPQKDFCISPKKKTLPVCTDESSPAFLRKNSSPVKNQAPLTCSKTKNNKEFFGAKQTLYSPQNLSNFLFDPAKKNSARISLTLNFLKDKIGAEKIEQIQADYKKRGFNKEFVTSLLEESEMDYLRVIEYLFNEKSPITVSMGSLDFDSGNLKI